MNTCDTCKHWENKGVLYCGWEHWPCRSRHIGDNHVEEDEASFDSDGPVTLHTGPKFGCIHHEPK